MLATISSLNAVDKGVKFRRVSMRVSSGRHCVPICLQGAEVDLILHRLDEVLHVQHVCAMNHRHVNAQMGSEALPEEGEDSPPTENVDTLEGISERR